MKFEDWYEENFGVVEPGVPFHLPVLKFAYESGMNIEREACAKLVEADGLARGEHGYMLTKAATRIRARGE